MLVVCKQETVDGVKNGEVVATQVGAAPKSKLTAFIEENI